LKYFIHLDLKTLKNIWLVENSNFGDLWFLKVGVRSVSFCKNNFFVNKIKAERALTMYDILPSRLLLKRERDRKMFLHSVIG
jgi:hypothetical protein